MPPEGWERGDLLDHDFPVHVEALRAGGADFLTRALRAAGSLAADNAVVEVTRLQPFSGGSTGSKAVLSVAYERPEPGLPEDLFVKFSRDLDDARRDHARGQMESEVRFGLLSSIPDFPVAVPRCLFAEYRSETGSGVLVSERIAFGVDGVEPLHPKARDHELDDVGAHYDALVSALGRLAGTHRAGRFPDEAMAHFAPRGANAPAGSPTPYTPEELSDRIGRYAAFAERVPQLLPDELRSESFLARLAEEGALALEHNEALHAARRASAGRLFAFCHWNANIDNAWFWRDEDGRLRCGLMDWGNVGQINMANALTSCLMFAEPDFVIGNLGHLLDRFTTEFAAAGGGPLDPAELERQMALNLVADALRLPLDRVKLVERRVPDLAAVEDRFDPRIIDDEFARTQFHILIWALARWHALDVVGLVGRAVG